MNLQEFRDSLSKGIPPSGLSAALCGLWWDAKGDWDKAHESAQQDESSEGAGFTLISTEKRETSPTHNTGTSAPASLQQAIRWSKMESHCCFPAG